MEWNGLKTFANCTWVVTNTIAFVLLCNPY